VSHLIRPPAEKDQSVGPIGTSGAKVMVIVYALGVSPVNRRLSKSFWAPQMPVIVLGPAATVVGLAQPPKSPPVMSASLSVAAEIAPGQTKRQQHRST
jgi:hypothetical protein